MSQTSGAEEFDPATGEFRPMRRSRATPATAGGPGASGGQPRVTGLSENGQRYGVFYEIFEHAAKSPAGTAAYRGAQVIIAVVFVLLLYEAVSYRMALGG